MIVGLVQADPGAILIDDLDVSHQPMHGRAGSVSATCRRKHRSSANCRWPTTSLAILETRKELDSAGRREELASLLQEFHISPSADNLGHEPVRWRAPSRGNRPRAGSNPNFILLDEPFAGVDPISVGDIKQIIRHLKANAASAC